MKLSALLMSVLLLLALVISPEPYQSLPHAEAATFTVDTLVDESDGDFSAGDFSLREAVEQANGSAGADVINLSVNGTITLSSQLEVTDDLTINGSGITLDGGNATRIMQVGSGATVTLSDLRFQNGLAGTDGGGAIINGGTLEIIGSTFSGNQANGSYGHGGAIDNSGTLEITGSTFRSNTVNFSGGAIFNVGTATITNSIFSNNQASIGQGGAIENRATLEITNSTLSGNTANNGGAILNNVDDTLTITSSTFDDNSARDGGAIRNYGTLTITGSTFGGNTATDGGAIYNDGGTLETTNSIFSGNMADYGGAIYNFFFGTATITNSIFSSNQADGTHGGSGAISSSGPLTITNSTFTGNTAYRAAAIGSSGTLTITNSTFSENVTGNDGGAIASGGTVMITNSTFRNNQAGSYGGAISSFSTLTITNSTFSGNIASEGGTLYRNSGTIEVGSSIIVAGSCDGGGISDGGNNLSLNATGCPGTVADPQLGPLQNNGGPTDTMLPALTSPAVDAYAAPCATATDQRGITRPQGPLCDIGATEQEGIIPTDTPVPPTDTPIPPTDTPGPVALVVAANCVDEDLVVTISSGDDPFNITASAGINTPVNGVVIGTTTINGPEKWDDLTVTETSGDMQSFNLGQFKCRSDERPVPLVPAHLAHITDTTPTFVWAGITDANNYRVFIFDNKIPANRTVDIRQNSGGPTFLTLNTPLPTMRLFWRARGRQNRIWSLWSVRFTFFVDPVAPFSVSTPVPTIDLNPPSGDNPVPTIGPAPTFPPPPNSR